MTNTVGIRPRTPVQKPSLTRRGSKPTTKKQESTKGNSLVDIFWQLSSEERFKQFRTPKAMSVELQLSDTRLRALADEGALPALKALGRIYIYVPGVVEVLRRQN